MLRFDSRGKFTILQVSDPQDLQYTRKTMLRMLDKAYDKVCPDLVIFTGDNVLGNHLRDARFGSREVVHTKEGEKKRIEKTLSYLLKPVAKRGIPFTYIYGNHDDMNMVSKEEQNEIYMSYPMCMGVPEKPDENEGGTFNVPIFSSDEKKVAFNLWCFDSARTTDGKSLCGVTKECLDFYKNKSAVLKKENGGKPVPSFIFQHIPMKEQEGCLCGCSAYSVGAIKVGSDFIKVNPKKASGVIYEPISAVDFDFGEADAIKECGDCLAVVTGHDHTNCFDGVSDGIRYIQTSAASFRCYGNKLRGVRVFEIDEKEPEKFNTYMLYYDDLCGTSLKAKFDYLWDADGEEKKKAALIAGAGIITACAGGLCAKILSKKGR